MQKCSLLADSLGGEKTYLYPTQLFFTISLCHKLTVCTMHSLISFLPLLTLFFLVFTCNVLASAGPCVGYDCLQEYVFREDGAYTWHDTGHRIRVDETEGGHGGWTGYYLNFTSQRWLTTDLVSRSEWWHILVVAVPDNISTTDTTLLWIGSGDNNDPLPDLADYDLLVAGGIATTNRAVTAALFQVSSKVKNNFYPHCEFHLRYQTQTLSLPMIRSKHIGGRTLPLLSLGLHTSPLHCQKHFV